MSIRTITIVGAGAMGHGIAQVAAAAGFETALFDVDPAALESALERVRANLDAGVAKGKVQPRVRTAALAGLRLCTDLADAARDADLVIEAVPEQLELKRRVFDQLDEVTAAACVYASNTSSISIAALAEGRRRPEALVGMHFFNPVHVMKLLEIVTHDGTDEATLQCALDVGAAMGKTPIVVKDSPGFASSRLGVALGLEAMRMLEAGVASAQDIDTAMELGYRHPMGPLRLTDLVGLDVRLGIAEYLHEALGSAVFEPPGILRRLVAEGRLGRKSGRGFYDWSD